MPIRSPNCDGAGEGTEKFHVAARHARLFGATFDSSNADAPFVIAGFGGTDADAPRDNDEFSAGFSAF
jgi:hypothetical protein